MRCINCGWDNADGATACIKCGRPLHQMQGNESENNEAEEAFEMPKAQNAAQDDAGGRKTVMFDPNKKASPEGRATVLQTLNNCPKCGYPVIGGTAACPNCGHELNAEMPEESEFPAEETPVTETPLETPTPEETPKVEEETPAVKVERSTDVEVKTIVCQSCGANIPDDYTFCPKCGMRLHRGTIFRPIRNVVQEEDEAIVDKDSDFVPIPQCSIAPIAEKDEKLETKVQALEGATIVLNRANTEASNHTITSKEQAVLTFEDGEWYIEDKSELHSTFIQLQSKYKLTSGDIIVLGDRRFLFKA